MPEVVPLHTLMQRGRRGPDPVAYVDGRPLDFAELELRARCWRTAFESVRGSRFVAHSPDAFEFAAMAFGAWHANKCLVVPSDLHAASVARLGAPVDGTAGEGDLVPGAPSAAPWQPIDPEAPLLEVFTSGSTGGPVRIPKCLRQIEQEILALAAILDPTPAQARVLGTVSHQHMYGLVFRLLLPLATGRSFEALRLTQVHDLCRYPLPEGCVVVSSPAQLARLPAADTLAGRIHLLLSAGGPLDENAARDCREVLGVSPFEIYGSSETGAVAWRRRAMDCAATWRALPGIELRERDGLLEMRGRQLSGGDWYTSADRVVMAGNGFELAGRADRIVKLHEKRVSLAAIERVLLASGLVRRAHALVLERPRPTLAVIAMPDVQGWELAAAGKPQLVAALGELLRGSAEVEVLPRSWRFVDPWPVTSDGKTPEALLRARFDRRVPEFRVVDQGAGRSIVELWVSPTAPFFQGHFPGHPILPGVAQIDWLVWLTREVLGVGHQFAGLDAAKFRRAIVPGNVLLVTLDHEANGSTRYEIARNGEVCASGRIRWTMP